ncbi:hypothetical protein ACLSU7_15125 [Bdellovibrio sp. HCB185ZH]|uniref:hypothetical protein n=1 Tax=Bdellovibrio sp. HCB185ZH TaxID=3394235 RepID=UPI0039A43869
MGRIQYHLFNPRSLSADTIKLSNDVYELWKTVYKEVLGKVGEPLNPDDFHRCDVIVALTDDSKVFGFHLYSSFDLRSNALRDHHYMKAFDDIIIGKFKALGINNMMSMEYLTVAPEYRSRSSDVNWSEIIIALGSRVMEAGPWDCLVGTARRDLNVRRKAAKSGTNYFGSVIKMNYECEILMTKSGAVQPLSDPKAAALVDKLWSEKMNHTDLLDENRVIPLRKIA